MQRRLMRVVGVVMVLTLVAAGCGDDDDGGGSATKATTETTAAGGATGRPIRFGSMCQLSPPVEEPECETVVQAVFAEYNAAGGLDGRPLVQVVCDNSGSDPANIAKCHTKLSEDDDVIAFIANAGSGAIGPVLERAGMASVSPQVLEADSLNSPNSFPISGWGGFGFAASAAYTLKAGKSKPGGLYPPSEPGFAAMNGIKSVYTPRGVQVSEIPADVDEATYTPFVAKAKSSGVDPLYVLQPSAQLARIFGDAAQLGYEPTFVLPYTCAHERFLDDISDVKDANGAICAVPFDWDAGAKLRATMKRYGKKDWKYSYVAVNSYVAAKMAIAALESIQGDVTRASFLDAMRKLRFTNEFLLEPIDFSKLPGPLPVAKQLVSYTFNIYAVRNGKLVNETADAPVDVLKPQ